MWPLLLVISITFLVGGSSGMMPGFMPGAVALPGAPPPQPGNYLTPSPGAGIRYFVETSPEPRPVVQGVCSVSEEGLAVPNKIPSLQLGTFNCTPVTVIPTPSPSVMYGE